MPVQWLLREAARRLAARTLPHRYHRFVCRLMGIRITVLGTPVSGGRAAGRQPLQLARYS